MGKTKPKKWLRSQSKPRKARPAAIVLGVVAGGLLWSCNAQNPPPPAGVSAGAAQAKSGNTAGIGAPADDPVRRFLGKGPAELIRELGPPTKVMPSDVTGGKIYVYARPGARYVFETGGTNRIDLAVTVE